MALKLLLTFYCLCFTDDLTITDVGRRVNGTLARKNNFRARLMKVITKIQMSKQGQEINTENFNLLKLIKEEIYTRYPPSESGRSPIKSYLTHIFLMLD